jgi:hypothetical protein
MVSVHEERDHGVPRDGRPTTSTTPLVEATTPALVAVHEAGAFAHLPSKKAAIALAPTFSQDAFASDVSYTSEVGGNAADEVWREIATVLAPEDPPPLRKP